MPGLISAKVVVFQSLSKRSNLPGMRVGFAAGDGKFLARFHELRNVAAPQVPVPLQQVAVAAYSDETHVEENRRLYRVKFDLADQILGCRYGYRRPCRRLLRLARRIGSMAVTRRRPWNSTGKVASA